MSEPKPDTTPRIIIRKLDKIYLASLHLGLAMGDIATAETLDELMAKLPQLLQQL